MKRFPIVVASLILLAGVAGPARAETSPACLAALEESAKIQDDAGLWLAERRTIGGRRKKVEGTYAEEGLKEEVRNLGVRYAGIIQRISALQATLAALRNSAPCEERARIEAALERAFTFLSVDVHAKRPPLPDGMCPSSPDLSAPLIPCPKQPPQ